MFKTAQFQCAEFGHGALKKNGDKRPLGAGLGWECCFNRRELFQFIIARRLVEHVAWLIVTADRRSEETKAGRFSHHQHKLLWWNVGLGSLLHSEGRHAKGFNWRL